jgi:aminoglycoside phosphotransferase (APT) family kinase protein
MPSSEPYALKVLKEQEWLPKLQAHLSVTIPKPLALGKPSADYPWHWSIYAWLEGESSNALTFSDHELEPIAVRLAKFIKELHKIEPSNELLPGLHNYWRGDHVSVYDAQARSQIANLQGMIDSQAAFTLWEKAVHSRWTQPLVWVHGDLSSGNILVKEGKLAAVIDFGGMGVGDPACDLVIAWTFFKGSSREIFKEQVNLDRDTWDRARGWAL